MTKSAKRVCTSWSFAASSASSSGGLTGRCRSSFSGYAGFARSATIGRRQGDGPDHRRRTADADGGKNPPPDALRPDVPEPFAASVPPSSPDMLFGTDGTATSAFSAPVSQRNIIAVAAHYPELALQGVKMRKFGQEIIEITAGKKIHGTGAIPGGVNKNVSPAERDRLLKDVPQMLEWARSAVKFVRDFTMDHLVELLPFGSFESSHLSLVREEDAPGSVSRRVACRGQGRRASGRRCGLPALPRSGGRGGRSWSYMKFPFLKSLGPEKGWYRVGPLARLNTCTTFPARGREGADGVPRAHPWRPNNVTMCYHWARMVELLHAIEVICDLFEDPDLQGDELCAGPPAGGGGGRHRGAAGHALPPLPRQPERRGDALQSHRLHDEQQRTDESRGHQGRQGLSDREIGVSEGLLNHIEVVIRAYDPCLSCATHAVGQMALQVQLVGPGGGVLQQFARGRDSR